MYHELHVSHRDFILVIGVPCYNGTLSVAILLYDRPLFIEIHSSSHHSNTPVVVIVYHCIFMVLVYIFVSYFNIVLVVIIGCNMSLTNITYC
jgi:hypothetical protein